MTDAQRLEDARELIDLLRGYPDFDDASHPFAVAMDQWLAGERPTILDTIDSLAHGVAPSPTEG